MIRQVKKRAIALMMVCILAALMSIQLLTVFAADARIAFSDPTGSVGSQINVKMKITSNDNLASADVMLSYDASLLEFVSGTNASGENGAVRVHGDGGTPNTGTLAFTLTFKALAAGTSKISVTSQEIYDSASQLVTVSKQGDSTVKVEAAAGASNDATLKSLQVSPGTLSPEFSPETDTYSVTVGTDVETLVVNAETTDSSASHTVEGAENLQMGENRVTCRVTAPDGQTTKEYVIVVTKAEGGASADSGSQTTSFKMKVSERTLTVLEPDASVEVPEGFKQTTIKIDGNEVTGWVWGPESEHQYCVIYAMNEAGEKGLYRYDIKDTERTLQRYFQDPAAADSVSPEVYNQLAAKYDQLRADFNLFKILLIGAIVIAVALLILLLIAVLGKGGKSNGGGKNHSSRRRKPEVPETEEEPERLLEEAEDEGQPVVSFDENEDPENGYDIRLAYADEDGDLLEDAEPEDDYIQDLEEELEPEAEEDELEEDGFEEEAFEEGPDRYQAEAAYTDESQFQEREERTHTRRMPVQQPSGSGREPQERPAARPARMPQGAQAARRPEPQAAPAPVKKPAVQAAPVQKAAPHSAQAPTSTRSGALVREAQPQARRDAKAPAARPAQRPAAQPGRRPQAPAGTAPVQGQAPAGREPVRRQQQPVRRETAERVARPAQPQNRRPVAGPGTAGRPQPPVRQRPAGTDMGNRPLRPSSDDDFEIFDL